MDVSQTNTLKRYDLMPIDYVSLSVEKTGDAFVTLDAAPDVDPNYIETIHVYYQYFYQRLGESGWTAFTSWVNASSTTFTPTIAGEYAFRVEAVNLGRNGYDAFAENAGLNGYYLETAEMAQVPVLSDETEETLVPQKGETEETTPTPTLSGTPDPEPVETLEIDPTPSAEPTPVPETVPETSPSTEEAGALEITSLALAQSRALSDVTGKVVTAQAVMAENDIEDAYGVKTVEIETRDISDAFDQGEMVIIQTSEVRYAVLEDIELDGEGHVAAMWVIDEQGESIIGGADDILSAWYYMMAEVPDNTPEPMTEPEPAGDNDSLEPEPTTAPEPEPEPTPEVEIAPEPEAEPEPEATQPSEEPIVSE